MMTQLELDLFGLQIKYTEGYAFFHGGEHLVRQFDKNAPNRQASGCGLHDDLNRIDVFPPSFKKPIKVWGRVYRPIRCKVRKYPPTRIRNYESAVIDQILDPHAYLNERMNEAGPISTLDHKCSDPVDPGYICDPDAPTEYIVSNGYDVLSRINISEPEKKPVYLYSKVRNERELLLRGYRFHDFPKTEVIPGKSIVLRVQNNCVVDLYRWNFYRKLIILNLTGEYAGDHHHKMKMFYFWTNNESIRSHRWTFAKD